MAAPKETNRSEYKLPYSLSLTWASSTALFSGVLAWLVSDSWQAGLCSGLVAGVLLLLSWRILWWKVQSGLLLEMQSFLMRCRVLPSDFKMNRRLDPKTIVAKKGEMLDLAYQTFSETEKKLVESRHILDKFVGTKASQFATEKGAKAVWEGELTSAIVMFSDVRGFTSLTEKLKPQETVRFLNRMFTELEEIIAFSGGEINKYIGDAILAYFPFPEDNPQSAVKKALLAALHMQDSFHLTQATFKQNYSAEVETGLGIGVCAGKIIIGNLGSARRMEFTVIGDTVNFASRLCSIAEDGQILINQDLALIAADNFRLQELDAVRIKGKSGTHKPYSLLGERLNPGLA